MTDNDKPKRPPTPGLVGLSNVVLWHDLIVMASGPTERRWPDPERMAAVEWVADRWYRRPIAPQRWQAIGPAVRRELKERAEAQGTSPEKEFKRSVINSLLLALDEAGGIFTPGIRKTPGLRKAIIRRLNDLVVEELLGSDWRRTPPEDIGQLEDLVVEELEHLKVEAALTLETLISKANLGKREAEVIAAALQDESPAEMAAKLDIKPGTARTALHRALKKLKSAV